MSEQSQTSVKRVTSAAPGSVEDAEHLYRVAQMADTSRMSAIELAFHRERVARAEAALVCARAAAP